MVILRRDGDYRSCSRSVGYHVLVIWHRVGVDRELRVRLRGIRRWGRASWGELRRPAPEVEMAQDLLDHAGIINDRDDAHRLVTLWAFQGVGVPGLPDQVAPFTGRKFGSRRVVRVRRGFPVARNGRSER